MQLIDPHLPEWQFQEQHGLWVKGVETHRLFDAIEPALRALDPVIESAIALRELPGRWLQQLGWGGQQLPARPFGYDSFTRLGHTPGREVVFGLAGQFTYIVIRRIEAGREVVFGLAGQFWRMDYGLVKFADAKAFSQLQSVPKLVLDVRLEPTEGACLLLTRTRVLCPDASSRRRFAPYWYLIRPVSGLIRRRLLGRIRSLAQTAP